jgi:hypothetical protein
MSERSVQTKHRSPVRRTIFGFLLGATSFFVAAEALAQAGPSSDRQLVRGYIAVAPTATASTDFLAVVIAPMPAIADIFLPDVEVFARNPSNNETVGPAISDLSGRFTLQLKGPARYEICWKAKGFNGGCEKDLISVSDHMENIGTVRIPRPADSKDTAFVFGKVHFQDGSRTRFLEPLANINSFAQVELLTGAGKKLDRAYVNNFDDYVLPRVPVNDEVILRATIDKGVGEQRIAHSRPGTSALGRAPVHSIDLAIANTPPRVEPLVPLDATGRRVKVAKPGAKLELEARATDADGDPIRYTWLPADGSGVLSSLSGQKVAWELPSRPGLFSVSVFVDDGKGGYAASSLSVRTDDLGIPFSGRVVDTMGAPVAGAVIDVNGQIAATGALGAFTVRVRDANLFVMNIRKSGFALNSTVYDNGVTGGQWTLARASIVLVDPAKAIDVTNEPKLRDCPGPASARLNFKAYPKLAIPQYQDGNGSVVQPFGDRKLPIQNTPTGEQRSTDPSEGCGPGIRVQIPPDALGDSTGKAPPGNVEIALSTVDLMSPEQMPGDYTAVSGGQTKVMQSFGAGSIEITAGNVKYNLKPGSAARVTIPVDRSQLQAGVALAPTIPLLFYDERAGVWREDGEAKLDGKSYVAEVKHFSVINGDTLKTDQACVRVLSPSLPPNYNLEVWIPQLNGAAPKVITQPFDNASQTEHVIYNLPLHTNIVLIPLRQNDTTPIGTFVVNTGEAQNPTTPNHPIGPHYDACATQVTLTDQALPDQPVSGEFLQGLFSFEATNLNELSPADPAQDALKNALGQATTNYYNQVDPAPGPPIGTPPTPPPGRRATLGGFRSVNAFGGANELHAIYANSGDLGFGRDMHCVSKPASDGQTDYACYVTNYGNILTSDSQDAIDAVANNNPVATVTMEYSRVEDPGTDPPTFSDPTRVVKFFVYNGNLDSSTLVKAADLDSGLNLRQRPVPQLCMVCHGGEYPTPATGASAQGHLPVPGFNSRDDAKLGSRFLPFDLHYYTFAGGAADKVAQQPAFKHLNQDIVENAPVDATIGEVIAKMYAGADPNKQDENFVAAGWQNAPSQPLKEQVYRDVVARTCRTCHVANSTSSLRFDQAQQMIDNGRLGSVELRVCSQYVMPHSKVTYQIFWGAPLTPPPSPENSKVAALQLFGDTFKTNVNGWQGNVCGAFTPGGTTPVTFFQSTIQPIFNPHCATCHIGANPPAGLNLDASHSLQQLVNVAATELNTMSRVAPNDFQHSYMYHKIFGDQGSVGGFGSQMPPTGGPLSAADMQNIQQWINTGASP